MTTTTTGLPGFYRATVAAVNDPLHQRRLRLRVPSVFGDVVTGWAEPLLEALLPKVGDRVWAAFEAGDKDFPLYISPAPIIPAGGVPNAPYAGQILTKKEHNDYYNGDFALEWVDRNAHFHGGPQPYSPVGHGH